MTCLVGQQSQGDSCGRFCFPKKAIFYPARSPIMWPGHSSHQEVGSVSTLFESGCFMAAVAHTAWRKECSVTWEVGRLLPGSLGMLAVEETRGRSLTALRPPCRRGHESVLGPQTQGATADSIHRVDVQPRRTPSVCSPADI